MEWAQTLVLLHGNTAPLGTPPGDPPPPKAYSLTINQLPHCYAEQPNLYRTT